MAAPREPALSVTVVHASPEGGETHPDGTLYCESPKPRLDWARRVGATATGVLFSLVPF